MLKGYFNERFDRITCGLVAPYSNSKARIKKEYQLIMSGTRNKVK